MLYAPRLRCASCVCVVWCLLQHFRRLVNTKKQGRNIGDEGTSSSLSGTHQGQVMAPTATIDRNTYLGEFK